MSTKMTDLEQGSIIIWKHIAPQNIAQAVGGCAAFLAFVGSLIHIIRHCMYNRTKLRTFTLRLLLLVPIFALDGWSCLMLEADVYNISSLLTSIRSMYEAVALMSFMQLVLTFLGGTQSLALQLEWKNREGQVQHLGPLKLILKPYQPGPDFVASMIMGILQYVVIMVLVFIMRVAVWELFEVLEGIPPIPLGFTELDANQIINGFLSGVKAVSCGWALYCITLFAHEVYEHLPNQGNLMLKFVSIKGIVFLTFWQGFMIAILQHMGILEEMQADIAKRAQVDHLEQSFWSMDQFKSGIKDFLLCIECLVFCVLHWFAYPAREWAAGTCESRPDYIQRLSESHQGEPIMMVVEAVQLLDIMRMHAQARRLRKRGQQRALPISGFKSPRKRHMSYPLLKSPLSQEQKERTTLGSF